MPRIVRAALLVASITFTFPAPALDRYLEEPILYETTSDDNPVSKLRDRIASGEQSLARDPQWGYLKSVLDALAIPVESQVLVFSKTSLQQQHISPSNPRAIYFNDDVYVGVVPGGDVLEISVADPKLGAAFYSLSQRGDAPTIQRQHDSCLQCHASSLTYGTPGHLIRSLFVDARGFPILKAGSKVTTHESPFEERWGGWYVTGTHGAARHMGNSLAVETEQGADLDREAGANLTTLPDAVTRENYLAPHSDLVALMVLEHQTVMHNLITNADFETRSALHDQAVMDTLLERPAGVLSELTQRRIANAGNKLLDYMLFAKEPALEAPIAGTSGFAENFAKVGPFDAQGRSLRDLDLGQRLFKYPCSYLIYSPQFDGLPAPMKEWIYQNLWEILQGNPPQDKDYRLTSEQRVAIREILRDTKKDLADYWRQG
jgi:hypothetical protein